MILLPERKATIGTLITKNEPGNACPVCFGPGKQFGDAPTPHVLILQFQGFTPDQAWDPAHEMTLLTPQYCIQQANPCVYQVVAAGIFFYWRWSAGVTLCSIEEHLGVVEYFRGDVSESCALIVDNELTTGINVATLNGIVTASWNPGDLE